MTAAPRRAQRLWAHHVATEYRSAAVATALLHRLMRIGCSPDTLAACHRVIGDELRHVELSGEVQAMTGDATATRLPVSWLDPDHAPGATLIRQAMAAVLVEFGLGETVAAALFRAQLRRPLLPPVRKVIAEIARDEARHSALGWEILEELLERDPEGRVWLSARLIADLDAFRTPFASLPDDCTPEEEEWGMLSGPECRRLLEQAVSRIVLPRLRGLGVVPEGTSLSV